MKPEVQFGLENAAWPALLVGADGAVLAANPAARNIFGAALAGPLAQLASLWTPENGGMAADFLKRWELSPPAAAVLKFRTADGALTAFSTAICPFSDAGKKCFILQLLPSSPAGAAEARSAPTGDAALKQKLDCVLQLARSVSLDFNNALTGVLAHTSLLLGKAEPGHPWRRSLLEVEKAAARGGDRGRTGAVQPAGEGVAPGAGGELEPGGRALRGIFPARARDAVHLAAGAGAGAVRSTV